MAARWRDQSSIIKCVAESKLSPRSSLDNQNARTSVCIIRHKGGLSSQQSLDCTTHDTMLWRKSLYNFHSKKYVECGYLYLVFKFPTILC